VIHFHYEEVDFKVPKTTQAKSWLKKVASSEGQSIKEINYIFCSDPYLLEINREHLDHDYLTDIITFDNSEIEGKIEADIFISIDRVKDNAEKFEVSFETEMKRVMVHGLLHLLGYKDKSKNDKKTMRAKEDQYLELY
jgi:probable rRNA maturation factor